MTAPVAPSLPGTLAQHPARARWLEDETKARATYLATRRHLAPFLVPHRFEGTQRPHDLPRARLGYGIALNRTYLTEIFGHLKGAVARYTWGPLAEEAMAAAPGADGAVVGRIAPAPGLGDSDSMTGPPPAGLAATLWADATMDGRSWKRLLEEQGLEWACSALGGFFVPDTNRGAMAALYGPLLSRADEITAGVRPFARFVPWSAVEDFAPGPRGLRWVTLGEDCDRREPGGQGEVVHHSVTYKLEDDGSTSVTRVDHEGRVVGGVVNMGRVCDAAGAPVLALVPFTLGEHPDVPHVGTGLLLGLDDIVIDLFNTLSEIREGYRDATFSVFVHQGPDAATVQDRLKEGSRFIALGESEKASLQRLAVDTAEVASGLTLIELGVKLWALSAKRQAEEATKGATARSGVSIVAEFQLDLKPLLVSIVERLDEAETTLLRILAQLAGHSWQDAAQITVARDTAFKLEDEASRLARIVTEFVAALPDVLPPEAVTQLALRWIDASDLFDADAPVAGEAGQTVREVIEAQIREAEDAKQQAALNMAGFAGGGTVPPGEQGPATGDLAYEQAVGMEGAL